ncbi:hypothetical protein NQ117_13045 [Paenibacillus sp. SC116]|uniref:hypothetical protein n=1 Tax=Paenibacillus sp. SC116 TaxID=2968986 RepID=UPI00215AD786|nr:hypothetical protein [Paenibacillus sp. SC116]MCR8844611.1 hypothetical protein [Paenibacillus sp. SC116]
MYKIESYLVLPHEEILQLGSCTGSIYETYPEKCFVNIEQETDMLNLLKKPMYGEDKFNSLVTIKYNDTFLIGYKAWGMKVWSSYINMIFYYLTEGNSKAMFGVNPTVLEMKPLGSHKSSISLRFDEVNDNKVIYTFTANDEEIIIALLNSANHYINKMQEYGFNIQTESMKFKIDKSFDIIHTRGVSQN